MIEQKATITQVDDATIWLSTQRQSSCGKCQLRTGCGSGLLSKHLGQRLSTIVLPKNHTVQIGQQVTVKISEQTFLKSTFWLYILPIILLLIFALAARTLALGDGLEMLAGIVGLLIGFYIANKQLNKQKTAIDMDIIEE